MSNLEHYMTSRYVNGGREWPEYDCWGLVRHQFHAVHGVWLPRYDGLDADNTLAKSRHYVQLLRQFTEQDRPVPGDVLAVVQGRACHHVGICIELNYELYALETDDKTGPRVVTVEQFKEDHGTVKFYAPTHGLQQRIHQQAG